MGEGGAERNLGKISNKFSSLKKRILQSYTYIEGPGKNGIKVIPSGNWVLYIETYLHSNIFIGLLLSTFEYTDHC